MKLALDRLELSEAPKDSPAFSQIVDRFEEGISRLEAIKYWSSKSTMIKASGPDLENSGRRLHQVTRRKELS